MRSCKKGDGPLARGTEGRGLVPIIAILLLAAIGAALLMAAFREKPPAPAPDPQTLAPSRDLVPPPPPKIPAASMAPSSQAPTREELTGTSQPAPSPQPIEMDPAAIQAEMDHYAQHLRGFQEKARAFRAQHAVYAQFVSLLTEVLTPLDSLGKEAEINADKLGEGLGTLDPADMRDRLPTIALAEWFGDIPDQILQLNDSGLVSLDEKDEEILRRLTYHMVETSAADRDPGNPHPEGTLEYYRFEQLLSEAAQRLAGRCAHTLLVLPPELAQEHQRLASTYDDLARRLPQEERDALPKPEDPYQEELERAMEAS